MILKALTIAAISAAVPAVMAFGLILSEWPSKSGGGTGGLDFGRLGGGGDAVAVERVTLADGASHSVRYRQGPEGGPLVVMVHGSGWDGGQFDALSGALVGVADTLAPDLRGHGAEPERRGDVDYIGQFEDDLAALVRHFRRNENQRVVMLGHSSGGGLVIRFANGPHGDLLDRAVLLAPFLQHDAPTARENSGGWAHPLTRRIIGLSMLNAVGIHALDHLAAIQFAMPEAVLSGPEGHRATTAYSWRLNQSFAPRRDWRDDVAALPPFLLVAGEEDEAFYADAYEAVLGGVTDRGQYVLLPDVGHLDVVTDARTVGAITEFLTDE